MPGTLACTGRVRAAGARSRPVLAAGAALAMMLSACSAPPRQPDTVTAAVQVPQPASLPVPVPAQVPQQAAAPAPAGTEIAPPLTIEPGLYRCELQRRVMVRRVDDDRSALVLSWQGHDHALKAVPARTGALRYESPQDGLTWLVISGKSMLLDSKRGAQLANECRL